MNSTSIRCISRAEIDPVRWDECISNAPNGVIYASSFYLDKMARHWDALVLDDYKAVMPLTWNRKAGFYYLYQPTLTPALGVFGENLSEETIMKFISSIPNKYRLIDISLNSGNESQSLHTAPINAIRRNNYILSLQRPYNLIYNEYNDNTKRNIKKSVSMGCVVEKNIPVEKIIALTRLQFDDVLKLKNQDFENFASLYHELSVRKLAATYGIFLDGELLSSAVYLFSHGRAYYILAGNHQKGKTLGTSHYLIDRFIADHARHDLILDFEGSDIEGLAFFYSGFGAKLEHFPALKINRLPWYIRWMK